MMWCQPRCFSPLGAFEGQHPAHFPWEQVGLELDDELSGPTLRNHALEHWTDFLFRSKRDEFEKVLH